MVNARRKIQAVLVLGAVVFAMIAGSRSASAEEMSCAELLTILDSVGEKPLVAINPGTYSVFVRSRWGTCQDSIENWTKLTGFGALTPGERRKKREGDFSLKLKDKGSGVDEGIAPKVRGAPSVLSNPLEKPTSDLPELKDSKTFESQKSIICNYQLAELWSPLWLKIEDDIRWLAVVFTIDINSDGITDDIGFRFRTPKKQDVTIRYFSLGFSGAARNYPRIRLADESIVPQICFGELTLKRPIRTDPELAAQMSKKFRAFDAPDLEAQASRQNTSSSKKPTTDLWVAIAVAIGLFGAGGLASFLLWRVLFSSDAKSEEISEEDEDENL